MWICVSRLGSRVLVFFCRCVFRIWAWGGSGKSVGGGGASIVLDTVPSSFREGLEVARDKKPLIQQ